MTEFGCSNCEYTSPMKKHVVRHINRKNPCGPGIKEIIEIPVEIVCEYCEKNFSTFPNLTNHVKNYCKLKDKYKDDEIKKLKEELRNVKNITINNNNNNNNTNNTNIIIVVNNYEETSIEKITDKIFKNVLKDEPYKMIPNLIKVVHFNPDIPENHNICLSNRNKNNKYLQVYRNGHWEITDKDTEIDNLINDKETLLGDWVEENKDCHIGIVDKFEEYLETKYDVDTAKLIKDEVELLLYNGRHLIKKN